jgi:hypothetical protein
MLYAFNYFTISLPCLHEYHLLFYHGNKKIVPTSSVLYHLLTPVALAQLVMGDGQKRNLGLVLCTDSFTIQEAVYN